MQWLAQCLQLASLGSSVHSALYQLCGSDELLDFLAASLCPQKNERQYSL